MQVTRYWGRMLEHIYGTTYQELLARYIYQTIGHARTPPLFMDQQQQHKMLKGYNAAGLEAPPINASFPAAGSIRSTVGRYV